MKTYRDVVDEKVEELPWHLPSNLFLLRTHHNVTMGKLSNCCGVSKAYISQLESGHNTKPSVQVVKRLADFWEMRTEELCFTPLPNQ